ncbi:MAG TPA: VOC family protein [Acidimicrobiia bacterium]|jgi:predicted enzyme related to lactoylglutathione lyase
MSTSESSRVGWLRGVIVDARDPQRLSEFWQAVLGVDVAESIPGWIQLRRSAGGALMAFQPVPDGDVVTGARLRVDVEVSELDAATARIEQLGGALIRVVRFRPGEEHRVMADPEGNEFNIVLPFPPGFAS